MDFFIIKKPHVSVSSAALVIKIHLKGEGVAGIYNNSAAHNKTPPICSDLSIEW